MIFTAIAFMQIGQALASRSQVVSFFQLGIFTNPTLLVMAVVTFLLQLVAIYVPFFEDFFQITPLSVPQLLLCIGLGILLFMLIEGQKWVIARQR
jgi:Ca2+-transporting ATPase